MSSVRGFLPKLTDSSVSTPPRPPSKTQASNVDGIPRFRHKKRNWYLKSSSPQNMPLKGILKLKSVLEHIAPQVPIVRHLLEDIEEDGEEDPEPEYDDWC
jgi:hypothetical protein